MSVPYFAYGPLPLGHSAMVHGLKDAALLQIRKLKWFMVQLWFEWYWLEDKLEKTGVVRELKGSFGSWVARDFQDIFLESLAIFYTPLPKGG